MNKFRSFPGGESNDGSGRAFPSAFGKKSSFAPREEPYHVRKAREDAEAAKSAAEKAERGRELNDVNFPALGSASSSWGMAPGGGKKTGGSVSFAALASDWKARDEQEKERAEIAEMRRQREEAERIAFTRVRPPAPSRFGYSHSRDDDTYEENYQDDERHYCRSDSPLPADDMDDGGGWTSVARPVKKARTMRSFAPPPPDTSGADGGGEWGTDHTSRGHEQDSIW